MKLHSIFCVALIVLVAKYANTFSIPKDDSVISRIARSIKYNTEDPAAFIKEVDEKLAKLLEIVPASFNEHIDPEDDEQLTLINTLTQVGKELKAISKAANSFNSETIADAHVNYTLTKVKNFGGLYKLGYEAFNFANSIVFWRERYGEEYMQSNDDSDTYYSVSDVDLVIGGFDVEELKMIWSSYYNILNEQDENFKKAVELIQVAAEDFNVSPAEFWYQHYSEEVMSEIENIMKELKPFYQLLHAEIRSKLLKKYGAGVIKPDGPIPEHLFKQIQSDIWNEDDYDLFYDYSSLSQKDDYPITKLFEIAENFYQSLGFKDLTEDFWNENMSEENVRCTAEVHDSFQYIKVKHCSAPSFRSFQEAHLHMGQVHGALLKKSLPPYFYNGYSLEDAVGKAVQLAAASPKHLQETGIFTNDSVTNELTANYNLQMAIDFLLNIPYYYTEIKLFTEILNDKIKQEDYNTYYWKLLEEYGGIEPPFDRSEDSWDWPYSYYKDFIENTDIIGRFYSNILAFQFYRTACQKSEHVGVLHNCDFYNNTEVGEAFKTLLAQGSSKPFKEVIKSFIPKFSHVDASAVLDYFEPTIDLLKKKNMSNIGWNHTIRQFNGVTDFKDEDIEAFVTESSKKIYELTDQIVKDIFENKQETEDDYENLEDYIWKAWVSAGAAEELKEIAQKAQKFYRKEFKNKTLEKAIEDLSKTGDIFVIGKDMESFLQQKELLLNISIDKDVLKYKTNPDDDNYVSYFPDIVSVYLNSTDSAELKYYWEKWREQNSGFTKDLFLETIESFKKAANLLEISVTDFWFKNVNSDFIDKMEEVIKKLKPFYAKLHYYVRQQLYDRYTDEDFSSYYIIPDHFMEQVLLQVWTNNSIVEKNFKWKDLPITDKHLEGKDFDALKLLQQADEFYQSIGFSAIDDDFWSNRLKPQNGAESETDCHATIYDLTPKVYMKYCESVGYKKLLQAFSYLGRVHYAKEKDELPAYYFDSYSLEYPVGEAVLLSASTPKYSQLVGLKSEGEISEDAYLNRLIRMAIHTIFNIHKYFVNTKIVYEILDGSVYDNNDITKRYWQLMIKYAGIEPPFDRKMTDFDFPYKFYTDLEKNYQMKKFFSDVLGYQFYEALCKISGHKGDLSTCNFYGSKEAGEKLKEMMQLGSSKPLKTVLKVLLGKRSDISANALLNYYAPVEEWLDKTLELGDVPSFSVSSRAYWRSEEIFE